MIIYIHALWIILIEIVGINSRRKKDLIQCDIKLLTKYSHSKERVYFACMIIKMTYISGCVIFKRFLFYFLHAPPSRDKRSETVIENIAAVRCIFDSWEYYAKDMVAKWILKLIITRGKLSENITRRKKSSEVINFHQSLCKGRIARYTFFKFTYQEFWL